MADRLTMIVELGVLARDAALRGDDRAAATLTAAAAQLLEDKAAVDRYDKRRQTDAARQKRFRSDPPPVTLHSVTSRDKRDGSQGFPTPLPNSPKHTTHTAGAREADGLKDPATEQRIARLTAVWSADVWGAVDAFLQRRSYRTWDGWLREMEKLCGPGSQFTLDDLAGVCRDDGALERPIASPGGLRGFLGQAALQRRSGGVTAAAGNGRRGGVAQRTFNNGVEALKDFPDAG